MFKNISIIVVLSFLIMACNDNYKPKKPDNLIDKDKMSEVLYDLFVINAAKGVNRKLLEAKGVVPETYILTKHNIDSLQFVESNKYYAFDTDVYKDIVEEIKLRLEKEKEEYEALQKIEVKAAKRRRDSMSQMKLKMKDSTQKGNPESSENSINPFAGQTIETNQGQVIDNSEFYDEVSNIIPTPTGSAHVLLLNDVPAAATGIIRKLTINSVENGNAQFQVLKRTTFNNTEKAGYTDTFEPVSLHKVPITVGTNDYEVKIPIKKGEYLAWASAPEEPIATYGESVGTGWWQGVDGPLLAARPLTYQPLTICFSYTISRN